MAAVSSIDITFIAKLVQLHDGLKAGVSPIGDVVELQSSALKALRQNMDITLLEACGNEFIGFNFQMCIALKERVLQKHWDTRQVSDWMYYFSHEIWALNASKNTFGPVKFSDESESSFTKRRSLGAKSTIPKVESLIELVQGCQQVFEELVLPDSTSSSIGGIMAAFSGSSLQAACGGVLQRTSTIAKGQIGRTRGILVRLETLLNRLYSIAEPSS